MLGRYIPLLVAVVIAVIIAGAMVIGSMLLGPRKPTRFKETTYECGMTPVGSARDRFPIHFYLVAMLFIVFDVEIVFMYPWAVAFDLGSRPEKLLLLAVMGVFVAVLFVAYFYELAAGTLEWGTEGEASTTPAPGSDKARPPIRFGNENSGPVRLPQIPRDAA